MRTKYFNKEQGIDIKDIEEIAEGIKDGKICIFPTETVYGIGTNALDEKACKKIYEVKNRNREKPLIVLVSDIEMLKNIVEEINELEKKLIEKFWPGPLTIIFRKKRIIPDIVTADKEYVGVRMTSEEFLKSLIEKAKVPIVAPSANLSGSPTEIDPKQIRAQFEEMVDYIIDFGILESDITSTVVKVEGNKIHILRKGKITVERLLEVADVEN